MTLIPKEKTKPSLNLWDYTILMYGTKLVGKSTLVNEIPGVVFLNAGGGLEAIECYQIPIPNWDTYMSAVAELVKTGSHSFKVVALDTVDRIHKLCVASIMKKLEILHPADLDFGKGWELVKDEFMRPLMALALSGMGLIMISHVKDKEIATRVAKYNKSVTTLQDHIWQMIEGVSGIIVYYTIETTEAGVKRVLKAYPSESHIAGDRTGKLASYGDIEIGPIGTNWTKIQKIFSGEIKKGE